VKKFCFMAAALALVLAPLSLGAQATAQTGATDTATSAGNPEFRILSFDIGYAPGWVLDQNEDTTPSLFGLNVRITDKLSAGIQTLIGAIGGTTYTDNFLLFKYSFLPQLRATVGFGAQGDYITSTPTTFLPASSLGIELIPVSRSIGGLAVTEFKVAFKYDSPFEHLDKGKILFALAFGIGF
jgi:hypothetical protein